MEQEKDSRSAVQQKLDSNLVLAIKQARHEPPFDRATDLEPSITIQPDGRVLVDLNATVSAGLLAYIQLIGGKVINSFESARAVRAIVPLMQIEALATRDDVKFISPAALATTNPVGRP